ncbi:MAG: sigma 54-interacting transcriptional regulator [Negativicutes bacterium]|nr:sigma 54-interacting transcriptional regulator [Negativicutes bacterium]
MAKRSEIMQQVFTQMFGLVVVDHLARIIFIEETYAKMRGLDPKAVIGCYIKDVIPTSKLPMVVESGKPLIGDVFIQQERQAICNRIPLIKEGVLIGAMSFQIFEGVETLLQTVNELQSQNRYYKEKLKKFSGIRYSLSDIIGSCSVTAELRSAILMAASSNATVLIQGETGTGKELVAHALHQESRRSHYSFVKLNCAAIPQELLESELFGYEEGSFTGARKTGKKGKFELANKGTLFLDEISQLSMAAQAKLLRVLQEKEIERVGGLESIPLNVRIVAATNDDLEELVRKGAFRSDLYYRLDVIPIRVAPLRDRKQDIPLLVEKFAEKYGEQAGIGGLTVSPEIMEFLMKYDWPGNIRELEHAVERAISLCNSANLQVKHFDWLLPRMRGIVQGGKIREAKDETEKQIILNTLRRTQGNKKKAAEMLGISRTLLYQKIHRLGVVL